MRNVLMVAYFFPPLGGAGVQRTLKFVKYLPEYGWQPSVLTARSAHTGRLVDADLQGEIPAGMAVHRTPALMLPPRLPWRLRRAITRWLLVVDEQLGWWPYAVHLGSEIIESEKIEALYTTSAPFTDHLVGYALKRRQPALPWVADFRDPWVDNFDLSFATSTHRSLASKLEQRVFFTADRVILNTPAAREFYRRKYPQLANDRLVAIENGYDPADFAGVMPHRLKDEPRFTIAHVGSIYGQKRTPRPFFEAVQQALAAGLVSRADLRILFVGAYGGKASRELNQSLGLADVVDLVGYVDHRQSIAYVLAADLLLLILGGGQGSELVAPAKLFEYLAAGKPILALAADGAAAGIVHEARAGVVVDPEDIPSIAQHIAVFYQRWRAGQPGSVPDPAVVARFDRRRLTARLAQTLEEISP